jgi:hypothetical protein
MLFGFDRDIDTRAPLRGDAQPRFVSLGLFCVLYSKMMKIEVYNFSLGKLIFFDSSTPWC